MTDNPSLEMLTADDFRRVVGSRFRLVSRSSASGSPASFEVDLAHVTEHAGGAPDVVRSPFSVLFHGPVEPVLPQGIYHVEHQQLGAFDLFVVPVGPDVPAEPGEQASAMRYEAVFG